MSFELVCPSCGAASGPTVGTCPFCKNVLSDHKAAPAPLARLKKLYEEGDLENALVHAEATYRESEAMQKDSAFLMLYSLILLETEGPSSKIRSALAKAELLPNPPAEVGAYLKLMDAKGRLNRHEDDPGEEALRQLIQANPRNPHALFLLGSHLFWVHGDTEEPIRLLEKCVTLRPVYLRAWACLASLYAKAGNANLALRCLERCLALEKNPSMVAYFQKLSRQLAPRQAA